MNKIEEALTWLGVDRKTLVPLDDLVWEVMRKNVKSSRAPMRLAQIVQSVNRPRASIANALEKLRAGGRAAKLSNGWIPLR